MMCVYLKQMSMFVVGDFYSIIIWVQHCHSIFVYRILFMEPQSANQLQILHQWLLYMLKQTVIMKSTSLDLSLAMLQNTELMER